MYLLTLERHPSFTNGRFWRHNGTSTDYNYVAWYLSYERRKVETKYRYSVSLSSSSGSVYRVLTIRYSRINVLANWSFMLLDFASITVLDSRHSDAVTPLTHWQSDYPLLGLSSREVRATYQTHRSTSLFFSFAFADKAWRGYVPWATSHYTAWRGGLVATSN
jgi:hypothetical protein